MSTVIRKPGLFHAARELRQYARENQVESKLLSACRAADRELKQGRTVAVAVSCGLKVMRS